MRVARPGMGRHAGAGAFRGAHLDAGSLQVYELLLRDLIANDTKHTLLGRPIKGVCIRVALPAKDMRFKGRRRGLHR